MLEMVLSLPTSELNPSAIQLIPVLAAMVASLATVARVRAAYIDAREFRRAAAEGRVDPVQRELNERLLGGTIRREWFRLTKALAALAALAAGLVWFDPGDPAAQVALIEFRNWCMAYIALGLMANSVLDYRLQRWAIRHAQGLPQPPNRKGKSR